MTTHSYGARAADAALVLGATMRLTRLITSDDLGQWWIKDPLDALFHPSDDHRHEPLDPRWHRYLSGLECPHCVGFWVGAAVLTSYDAVARKPGRKRAIWRFVAAALTLNTVSVLAGKHTDYWS